MEFNSIFFIIFFLPISITIYYLTPTEKKSKVLLIISSFYCGMISIYLLMLMYIVITLNYFSALYIQQKRTLYILSLIFNISLFILMREKTILSFIVPMYAENTFLPICVSFFPLQFIGYITDVYKSRISVETKYMNFALYILFFPKLIIGPFVDYEDFYPSLKRSKVNLSILGKGLIIFIKGLAKNVIIGNSLYPLYQAVMNIEIENLSSLSAWLGIFAFSLSFYFCFSGMLDMAVGLSYCFGYKFTQDFDHPFFASGLMSFFSRWNISVVKWFEKYVSNPIKSDFSMKYIDFFTTILSWILIGLWYEISWNKFIWGAIIGIFIAIEKTLNHKNGFSYISMIYTFVITSIGWVFFSQKSLRDALIFIKVLFYGNNNIADTLSFYLFKSYIVILLIAIYVSTDLFKNLVEKINDKKYFSTVSNIVMPAIDFTMLIISISIIVSNKSSVVSVSSMFG